MAVPKQPLVKRIIIAFVLMTFVISGLFSVSIVAIVHYVEEQLVSNELDDELNAILEQDAESRQHPTVDPHTRFFSDSAAGHPIPPEYAETRPGFNEFVHGEEAFYIYKRVIDGHIYMLVQDQQLFETRENVLFYGVLSGFVLSLAAAWLVGWLVARRVIAPVVRLAQQVRNRDQLLPIAPPLAAEYANDEVGHLAQTFDHTLGQLHQALEREHLFTSDVSHELRTPLMVIGSTCELLLESDKLDAAARDQVKRMSQACAEMRDLVHTFLMLARSESATAGMDGAITLAAAAQEQHRRWAADFAKKGLDFSLHGEPADGRLYNATFLTTVISNLLRNALHYTERGSVRLVLDNGVLRVEDTGIGIPPDQHVQVFQPFVRGRQAPGEGLGLGLSLVKRICEHQGWQISLIPRLPTGIIFELKLQP